MTDNPVSLKLSITGQNVRDELLESLNTVADPNTNLSSIVQNHLDAHGVDAKIRIDHQSDGARGHQIRARGSFRSANEIQDIVNQAVNMAYLSLLGASRASQMADSHYFLDRLRLDDPDWSDKGLLIASDSLSGVIDATRSYIWHFINEGDFFVTYELGGLDVDYSIVDRNNTLVTSDQMVANLTDVGIRLNSRNRAPESGYNSELAPEMR